MANATGRGGFQKGQSGNPGGRPRILADIRELARAHTAAALNTLVEIVGNEKAPPAARVVAANSILDRGYGKPEAKVEANINSARVIRVPEICKTVEEWSTLHIPNQPSAR